ncbi:hypothetical protein GCM10022223_19640 [Kineosporia mesophila]|uniref:Uncharacterized protein n=1 Tax=Kineosporia mesophila TaxID=566012 RepID=A0ABP6ZAZ7_9ACTN|nr:hypothetical protein [Kineosporia mesophila]MCD5353350.1 hypothetical protein [Kineosporia mesophila]
MTDRQYPPRSAGDHGSTTVHHGRDPGPVGETEEPKKPKLPVNVIQVSASAGAAVTSAIAASYFGVGGTIAGAAFGSVVSTVAGAFYSDTLGKAHKVVATTTAVVVQRFPGDMPQAESIHRMNGPAGVPAADSLNRVGSEDTRHVDVEHMQVPINDETQVMNPVGDAATRMMPPVTGADGHSSYQQQTRVQGAYQQQPAEHRSQTYRSSGAGRASARRAEPQEQTWWKKPGFLLTGISLAGFLIAFIFILGTEGVLGHPISGGESGNTLTKLTSSNTSSNSDDDDKSTPTESATPSATATPTESVSPTATAGATVAPTETAAPTETVAPTATDAAPDTGSGDVQPTDQTQSADGSADGSADTGDTGADSQVQQEQSAP